MCFSFLVFFFFFCFEYISKSFAGIVLFFCCCFRWGVSSTTNQSGTKQCCSAEFDNLLFAFGNVKYLLLQSNVFLLLLLLLLLLLRDKTKMPETISPGHKSLSVMNSPENRNQCAASTHKPLSELLPIPSSPISAHLA